MSRNEKSGRRLSDVIPAEITDTPIIGMTGGREMTVDGFRGVEDYSEDEIRFRAGAYMITVRGGALTIRYLSLHTIVIAGEITAVELMRR